MALLKTVKITDEQAQSLNVYLNNVRFDIGNDPEDIEDADLLGLNGTSNQFVEVRFPNEMEVTFDDAVYDAIEVLTENAGYCISDCEVDKVLFLDEHCGTRHELEPK